MHSKILLLLLMVFASVHSQDTISNIIPNETLFKKTTQHSFSISPNGKYFVEVIENNIENDIVVIDIENYSLFERIPIGKTKIQNVYWLNNNRLIYEALGEIKAIDIDGTNSSLIVGRLAEKLSSSYYSMHKNFRFNSILSFLPENKNEILIETYDYQAYSTVKRVNIFTGQKITVMDGKYYKMNKWVVDYSGDIRFGVRFEKDESLVYYSLDEETEKWKPFEISLDDKMLQLKVSPKSYLAQNISFHGFGYDDSIIYLTTNSNLDKRRLISYSLDKQKIEAVLLEKSDVDIDDPHGEGLSLIFNAFETGLAGIRYQGILPKFKWFSSRLDEVHSKLQKRYSYFFNDIIDYDSQNTKLLVRQWSDTSEGNIGVYDIIKDEYSVMFHFNDELDKYKLSKTKTFSIETRDGWKVPSYLNLPVGFDNTEPIPLVVIPHGGPWARDYWELDDFSQYFANRGFAVLRTNFRGSTGFGKEHLLAGVHSIDEIMINDIADATKFIIEKCKIDKSKVFVFGHSYGGYATYMSLIKYPDIFSKGVALSAPADLKDWMKIQKKEKNYFAYEFWNTALGENSSKYLDKISPINHVENLNKPLLVFHGKKDGVIPVEQSEEMIKALKKYNSQAKLEVLQNEGHSIHDSNSLGYILDSANDFFKEE